MSTFVLPNVRKMFVPDPGYTLFDADLKGADAQVVAWDANDADLMQAFRDGLDVHVKNATDMLGEAFTSLQGFQRKQMRQQFKAGVHLTNYGGKPRTLAMSQNWTMAAAKEFQDHWFALHPAIKEWHDRVQYDLSTTRTIYNKFGFRIIYFDRIDGMLPKALAWIPQSTIARNCVRGAVKLEKTLPWAEVLLQVHDNVVFQVPHKYAESYNLIRNALSVEIPYPEPLQIPWELKKSTVSWGDCQKIEQ